MQRTGRRLVALAAITAAALFGAPAVANAAPATSAVDVSAATVRAGETFTVTQQLHNPADFTVTGAKAGVYAKEKPITDLLDVVSCTGTIAPCGQYLSSFRGPVGDLGPGESRTVRFTFRVKAGADFTLQHQFVGDNYAYEIFDGPVVKVLPPNEADIKVTLGATPRASLLARVDYVITVSNNGPMPATGVRVTANAGAGRSVVSATGCTRSGATASCPIGTLASGATATAKFTSESGVLAWGPFTATARRTAGTPADPEAANDSASKKCTAVTGLYVHC